LSKSGPGPKSRALSVICRDRILYKLDDLVRPYVHKILVVIEPLLIDEDYYARLLTRCEVNTIVKLVGQELQLTRSHRRDHVSEAGRQ
jgi:splicing factor 3B subunit 1